MHFEHTFNTILWHLIQICINYNPYILLILFYQILCHFGIGFQFSSLLIEGTWSFGGFQLVRACDCNHFDAILAIENFNNFSITLLEKFCPKRGIKSSKISVNLLWQLLKSQWLNLM